MFSKEPAMVTGIVVAAIQLLVAFGAPIDGEQQKAILGLVAATLTVLGAFWTRWKVAPV